MTERDAKLQPLIDKDEIREVIYRFARVVDRCDWELAASRCREDVADDHGVFNGRASEYVPWPLK